MKNILFIVLSMISIYCFGQKIPLTPDLVINGGYIEYESDNIFSKKIEGVIDYKISKDELHENIAAFIFLNKCDIVIDKNEKVCFFCKEIPIGSDTVTTPVRVFTRSKSKISFMVTMDILDSTYKYEISDVSINRRVERINIEYLNLAPQEDLKKMQDVGFAIGSATIAGIDLPTKGNPNETHWKRIFGMVAERNGYVNLCIKEGKTTRGLKDQWVENIKVRDARLSSEMQLYKNEYAGIIDFVKKLNEKIINE